MSHTSAMVKLRMPCAAVCAHLTRPSGGLADGRPEPVGGPSPAPETFPPSDGDSLAMPLDRRTALRAAAGGALALGGGLAAATAAGRFLVEDGLPYVSLPPSVDFADPTVPCTTRPPR